MEKKNPHLLRLAGTILGLTLLVSTVVVIVGMVLQWSTPVQFSNSFFAAGMIVIVFGALSISGGFQQRANFPLTYAETASQASISERGKRMMADINQRYGVMILLIGTGLLLIFISIAIHWLS